VVLPKGRWFDFWTGKESGNGEAVTVQPADHRIPVFVRNGALIPLMEARLHAPRPGEKVPLEVRHYGEQPGEFRLYDDDGETFAFERGACQWTSLNYQEDADGVWLGTLRGEASESQHFSYDPVIWLHMESKAD
jgi:alpha-D-xyloside xylohydrolase